MLGTVCLFRGKPGTPALCPVVRVGRPHRFLKHFAHLTNPQCQKTAVWHTRRSIKASSSVPTNTEKCQHRRQEHGSVTGHYTLGVLFQPEKHRSNCQLGIHRTPSACRCWRGDLQHTRGTSSCVCTEETCLTGGALQHLVIFERTWQATCARRLLLGGGLTSHRTLLAHRQSHTITEETCLAGGAPQHLVIFVTARQALHARSCTCKRGRPWKAHLTVVWAATAAEAPASSSCTRRTRDEANGVQCEGRRWTCCCRTAPRQPRNCKGPHQESPASD